MKILPLKNEDVQVLVAMSPQRNQIDLLRKQAAMSTEVGKCTRFSDQHAANSHVPTPENVYTQFKLGDSRKLGRFERYFWGVWLEKRLDLNKNGRTLECYADRNRFYDT